MAYTADPTYRARMAHLVDLQELVDDPDRDDDFLPPEFRDTPNP